jgi:hypothetical protein
MLLSDRTGVPVPRNFDDNYPIGARCALQHFRRDSAHDVTAACGMHCRAESAVYCLKPSGSLDGHLDINVAASSHLALLLQQPQFATPVEPRSITSKVIIVVCLR